MIGEWVPGLFTTPTVLTFYSFYFYISSLSYFENLSLQIVIICDVLKQNIQPKDQPKILVSASRSLEKKSGLIIRINADDTSSRL